MDLTQLADGGTIDPDGASSPESAALLNALTGGDINALITILEEGLPGITEERKAQLQEDASSYPLIDGVAGSILFPTIIRNVNTGQGEPLGFIFAVDEGYDTGFGLHDIDGEPVRTADLRDGIGDVFVDLVGLWEQSGETARGDRDGNGAGGDQPGRGSACAWRGGGGAAAGRRTKFHAAAAGASRRDPEKPWVSPARYSTRSTLT